MTFFRSGPAKPNLRQRRKQNEMFRGRKTRLERDLIAIADAGYTHEARGIRARAEQKRLRDLGPHHFVDPHEKLIVSLLVGAVLGAAYVVDLLFLRQAAEFVVGQRSASDALAIFAVWVFPAAVIVIEVFLGWRLSVAWQRRIEEDRDLSEVLEWAVPTLVVAAVIPSTLIGTNLVADLPSKTFLTVFQVCLSAVLHLAIILGAGQAMQAAGWLFVRADHHWHGMKAQLAEDEVRRLETRTRVTTMRLAQLLEEASTSGIDLAVGPLPDQTVAWINRSFGRDIFAPARHGAVAGSGPGLLPDGAPRSWTPPPVDGQADQPGTGTTDPPPESVGTATPGAGPSGPGHNPNGFGPQSDSTDGVAAEAEYLRSILDAQTRNLDGELA